MWQRTKVRGLEQGYVKWRENVSFGMTTVVTDPIARGFCHRGKLEVAGNEGLKQAGKADRAVVPLRQNPLAIGSVTVVEVQMSIGSFYTHANFCSGTKPSSTLPKPAEKSFSADSIDFSLIFSQQRLRRAFVADEKGLSSWHSWQKGERRGREKGRNGLDAR